MLLELPALSRLDIPTLRMAAAYAIAARDQANHHGRHALADLFHELLCGIDDHRRQRLAQVDSVLRAPIVGMSHNDQAGELVPDGDIAAYLERLEQAGWTIEKADTTDQNYRQQ